NSLNHMLGNAPPKRRTRLTDVDHQITVPIVWHGEEIEAELTVKRSSERGCGALLIRPKGPSNFRARRSAVIARLDGRYKSLTPSVPRVSLVDASWVILLLSLSVARSRRTIFDNAFVCR